MADQFFDPPVRIELGKVGTAHSVATPRRAAEILLAEWPAKPGARHLAARRAVLKALESARDARAAAKAAEEARAAFAAAAEEAGILLPAPPASGAPPGFRTPDWNRPRKKRGR